MIVYHRTDHHEAILTEGFRDGTGLYMTRHLYSGVWVSDRPLDGNEGAFGDVVLAMEIDEHLFAEYEWVEEGKGYRESLMPADRLNLSLQNLREIDEDAIDPASEDFG